MMTFPRTGRAASAALLALTLSAAPGSAAAQPAPAQSEADRTAIVNVVQQLFDAMAARSSEQALKLVVPEGQIIALREENGAATPRPRTLQAFADGLAGQKSSILERMWNPDVQLHGLLATLSTRYDFHQDGKFTHCGTDVFNLVKTADGWKVASGIYTVERTGCAPSPLGPPKQ
jgi:putative lumazine-binding protein